MLDELLMIPGPTNIAHSVIKEMSSKTVAHYGQEWTRFYNKVRKSLNDIIHTEDDIFLFVGSGHAALDSAIGSIIEKDDKVLVLSNGIFGEKLGKIAKLHKAKVTYINVEWGEVFDLNEIEDIIRENDFKAILMVDVETSTGVRNPIKQICKIAKKYNILTFVDAVCSLGIEKFYKDDWLIDVCVSASQKGLGAPPGLAIVSINDFAWKLIKQRKTEIPGWYLNLEIMKEFELNQGNYQPYGITMAIHNVFALSKSLELINDEGLNNRIYRHEKMAKYFRENIKKMNLKILCNNNYACNGVTAIECPSGYNSEDIVKKFKKDYNIRIASGLGRLANEYVRVGHMNQGASKNSLVPVISAFKDIIR